MYSAETEAGSENSTFLKDITICFLFGKMFINCSSLNRPEKVAFNSTLTLSYWCFHLVFIPVKSTMWHLKKQEKNRQLVKNKTNESIRTWRNEIKRRNR